MTIASGISELRCLIFGGEGFIGTNLRQALVGKVNKLTVFSRKKKQTTDFHGVDWIIGDFMDSTAVSAAVEGYDVVFHLITSTTPYSSNLDKIYDVQSNVLSTLHLLDACRKAKVKRIIFVSSGGTIYGKSIEIPTSENAPTNPISSYGISKLVIEKYLALYEELYGLKYVALRVANPYGPYQNALKNQGAISAFLNQILQGNPVNIWGDGSCMRDYIYIDDLVEALIASISYNGNQRVFNIGSGTGHSLNQIVETISNCLNQKVDVNYLEARAVDIPKSVLNIDLANKELKWQPTHGLELGIKKTIAWLNNNDSS